MFVETACNIGDLYLFVLPSLAGPEQRRTIGHLAVDVLPGAGELQTGVAAEAKKDERVEISSFCDVRRYVLPQPRGSPPIAGRQRTSGEASKGEVMVGIGFERCFEGRQRFLVAMELPENLTALGERVGVTGFEDERGLEFGNRVFLAIKQDQRIAEVDARVDIVGLQGKRHAVLRRRLFEPRHFGESVAETVVGLVIVAPYRDRPTETFDRFVKIRGR